MHSFTVTFGTKYLTGMITRVPPYETFSLIKNNILHQSKNYKNHFENSNFWGMWPLGHVGHVTYSFINMLFISTGIVDKLRPHIVSVGTTANGTLTTTIYWPCYRASPCLCCHSFLWWCVVILIGSESGATSLYCLYCRMIINYRGTYDAINRVI